MKSRKRKELVLPNFGGRHIQALQRVIRTAATLKSGRSERNFLRLMFINAKSGNTRPVRYELHIEGRSSEVRNARTAEALKSGRSERKFPRLTFINAKSGNTRLVRYELHIEGQSFLKVND